MRVLYIITAAEFGGPSRHVLWLMQHVMKQGHQAGLVAAPEPRLLREAQRLGAHVFSNPYFVLPVQLHNDMRALAPVFQSIKRFKPDFVSAHSTKAGFAARICCTLLRIKPVIFTAHGWAFTEGRSPWRRYLLALGERLAAKFTTKCICVSEHDRDLTLQFKVARPDQLVVIHNGIDPQPFLKAEGSGVREEFRLDSVPIITLVGRLVPQKDPLTLLKACLLLEQRFKVFLVGDGVLRAQVERFLNSEPELKESVILTGQRENVAEILAASDIFVLSSRWEGLPRAVIEAMMAGLPVVATRVGGVSELVEDGVTGFLAPRGEPKALAQELQKLLDDESLRQRMGQAGRIKAVQHFTIESMLHSTQAVYNEVLARSRA